MSTRKYFPILVIIALLVCVFGFAAPTQAAAGDIVISYTLPAAQINAGQTFSVPVNISVVAGKTFTAGQFNLSWNPAALTLTSITNGAFFPGNCPAGATPFFNNATINAAAGTRINYGFAALGVAAGQGCTGNGLLATLNFTAVANGVSNNVVSGILMSSQTGAAFPAADTTFPNFNLTVGAAPRLVVTGIAFTPNGGTPPGSIFNAVVTVVNQGGSASTADTLVVSATNATPASSNVAVPALAAGATQSFTVGLTLTAGAQNSVVTAAIASFSTTASGTYSPVSSSATTAVDATLGAYILIAPDAALNFAALIIGTNNIPGSINVKCNTNYEVDVTDANTTAWHMTAWNGTAFVAGGPSLSSAMAVTSNAQAHTVTAGSPALLLTGTVAGQSGSNGEVFGLTYTQTRVISDALLPAGQTYHLVLTYNGFVTL